eukprot:6335812-Prymnesium_polylepis.1
MAPSHGRQERWVQATSATSRRATTISPLLGDSSGSRRWRPSTTFHSSCTPSAAAAILPATWMSLAAMTSDQPSRQSRGTSDAGAAARLSTPHPPPHCARLSRGAVLACSQRRRSAGAPGGALAGRRAAVAAWMRSAPRAPGRRRAPTVRCRDERRARAGGGAAGAAYSGSAPSGRPRRAGRGSSLQSGTTRGRDGARIAAVAAAPRQWRRAAARAAAAPEARRRNRCRTAPVAPAAPAAEWGAPRGRSQGEQAMEQTPTPSPSGRSALGCSSASPNRGPQQTRSPPALAPAPVSLSRPPRRSSGCSAAPRSPPHPIARHSCLGAPADRAPPPPRAAAAPGEAGGRAASAAPPPPPPSPSPPRRHATATHPRHAARPG